MNPGAAVSSRSSDAGLDRPSLGTLRMWLRPIARSDAHWLWQLDQDAEVMRWISGGQPTPREEIERVLLPRMLVRYAAGPQFGFWAAGLRGQAAPIGWFHLRPGRLDPFEMELGYRLFRAHWGQGLATEGSRELVRAGFEDWGLSSVAAHALIGNSASRRVMEKCGLRYVRDWTVPADWLPGWPLDQRRAAYYRLEAATWREANPGPTQAEAKP